MEIKGFPPMPVVKLTDEQIAAGKAGAEKFKEKLASGEIVIKPLDGPSRDCQIFCVRAGNGLPSGRPCFYQVGLINRSP